MDPAMPKPTAKMTNQSWSSAREGLSVSCAMGLTGVLLCQIGLGGADEGLGVGGCPVASRACRPVSAIRVSAALTAVSAAARRTASSAPARAWLMASRRGRD